MYPPVYDEDPEDGVLYPPGWDERHRRRVQPVAMYRVSPRADRSKPDTEALAIMLVTLAFVLFLGAIGMILYTVLPAY